MGGNANYDGEASDLWVFGYGSLMWRPGFAYAEAHPAVLRGWHRALCVYSWHHRGTRERPGLVLGLDRGGACRGVAFRIPAHEAEAVRAYLIAREQVTMVYAEIAPQARLDDGRTVRVMTFSADRAHPQYAGRLTVVAQADLVRDAQGVSGRNVDYLANTLRRLAEIGVRDSGLTALGRMLAIDWRPSPAPAAAAGSEF
jgi:cation transport protein ChaC